eukprot:403338506
MEEENFNVRAKYGHVKLFLYETFTTAFLVMAINFSYYNKLIVCGAVWVCCAITSQSATIGTAISHYMLGALRVVIFKPAVYEWNVFYVAFVEGFFTLIFLVVVMHNKTMEVSLISDLILGVFGSMIALYFCICCSATFTGACISPTVALINHIYVHVAWDDPSLYVFTPSYVIGPCIGGVIAALFARKCSARFSPKLPQFNPLLSSQALYSSYGIYKPLGYGIQTELDANSQNRPYSNLQGGASLYGEFAGPQTISPAREKDFHDLEMLTSTLAKKQNSSNNLLANDNMKFGQKSTLADSDFVSGGILQHQWKTPDQNRELEISPPLTQDTLIEQEVNIGSQNNQQEIKIQQNIEIEQKNQSSRNSTNSRNKVSPNQL